MVMKAKLLKEARRQRGWTQRQAAERLGVTQAYVSMLEAGARRAPAAMARKLMKLYGLGPTALPLEAIRKSVKPATLAKQLGALGYPGFAHLRTATTPANPASFLLAALSQERLEARVAEGLPWLVARYPDMDFDWLIPQARMKNLQNRLGFCVMLARLASGQEALRRPERELAGSKLAREGYWGREPNAAERRWLRAHRSQPARRWNLLSDLDPEDLRYVAKTTVAVGGLPSRA